MITAVGIFCAALVALVVGFSDDFVIPNWLKYLATVAFFTSIACFVCVACLLALRYMP